MTRQMPRSLKAGSVVCQRKTCDKERRLSKVMHQCASNAHCSHSGLDGLAWEGPHGGCLVTTNLLKCLTNIRDRAVFWQWIVKGALYCNLGEPWTTNSILGDTHMIYVSWQSPDRSKTCFAIMGVRVCVSYLRRVYLVTLSMLDPCHF